MTIQTDIAAIISGTNFDMAKVVEILENLVEEGTWTPELFDASASAEGATYTEQTGRYIRTGNLVNVWGTLTMSGLGTLTGTDISQIGGLPYDVSASNESGFAITRAEGLAITAGTSLSGRAFGSQDRIFLYKWTAATGTESLRVDDISADGDIEFFGSYRTTDTPV